MVSIATIVTSFFKKNHTLLIVTFKTQCCLLFQHVKVIQKIHPKSTIFFKLKTIGSHLKAAILFTLNIVNHRKAVAKWQANLNLSKHSVATATNGAFKRSGSGRGSQI